jgi:hypothetical protein
MGITSTDQLPNYNEVRTQLEGVIKQEENNE